MAPGVGKTYRMLEEGHRRRRPRHRPRRRLRGGARAAAHRGAARRLEVVPRRRVEYRGVVVEEMDTDAVIARAPTVALIDELAHTNAPGSARAKRWEDVELIRDAGIHVVTTHERPAPRDRRGCRRDDHRRAGPRAPARRGARRGGRDRARGHEPACAPPADAPRQRVPARSAQVALERFFTESNLTALREISLRLVARRVEGQLEDGLIGRLVPLVTEQVLVLVDGGPASGRAVRRAAAVASALRGRLIAVVAETPASARRAVRPAA